LLDAFELTDAADRLTAKLSGGMRRKLDIAASIFVSPDLLFLDEPTTGLDPRSRNDVWELVRSAVVQGASVLLTTQYLEEADRLAARIAIIDHGAVVAEGTRAQLKASVGYGRLRVRLADDNQRADAERLFAAEFAAIALSEPDPASLAVQLPSSGTSATIRDASRAVARLDAAGVAISGFSFAQPSPDEVFLALTAQGAPTFDDVQEPA
jgi:ABC-2 type transport system ATP-binding protein